MQLGVSLGLTWMGAVRGRAGAAIPSGALMIDSTPVLIDGAYIIFS